MNRENILAWIEALESGEYGQTKGVLHDKTGFCCFGVLCDIQGVEWEPYNPTTFTYKSSGKGVNIISLPDGSVLEWAGLKWTDVVLATSALTPDQQCRLGEVGHTVGLATLNDRGFTFKEIAALLREAYSIPA